MRGMVQAGESTKGAGAPGLNTQVQGKASAVEVIQAYLDRIAGDIHLARPLKVVLDCGNGVAGLTAGPLIRRLGCEVTELYCDVDGNFPNHHPDPSKPENLADLIRTVQSTDAEIGLAFDGDADRCFVVDERGNPVSPSAVTALVADRELTREPGATVIHNLITSRVVPELIAQRGGTALRSRVGHSYIKGLMAQSGAIFGGEHSAHYYFRDFWGADSGMLAGLHVLAALGEQSRSLSQLMAQYQLYAASGEMNYRVNDAPACVAAVVKSFEKQTVSLDHLDGVTVDLGDGAWFNLRTSNTEPLLRLNVEARTPAEIDRIVGRATEQIAATP
jgi:phosphomannomutase